MKIIFFQRNATLYFKFCITVLMKYQRCHGKRNLEVAGSIHFWRLWNLLLLLGKKITFSSTKVRREPESHHHSESQRAGNGKSCKFQKRWAVSMCKKIDPWGTGITTHGMLNKNGGSWAPSDHHIKSHWSSPKNFTCSPQGTLCPPKSERSYWVFYYVV